MKRAPLVSAAVAVGVVLLAGGAALGGYALTGHARGGPRPAPTRAPAAVAGSAAARPTVTNGPAATTLSAATVNGALAGPLRAAALGREVHAEVLDPTDGRVLLARAAVTGVAPASTAKLLTAAALLVVHTPQDRFTTTVRAGRAGDVVLVGGGDPTLSAAAPGRSTPYAHAARISDLAAAVRRSGVPVRRVVVDDSLFAGPSVSPDWAAEDVPSDYASPVTAVMADGGRDTPAAVVRSRTPDLAAGRALAADLRATPRSRAVPVVRGRAVASARVLGSVRSAPVDDLIAQMLQQSDNMIAECLGRQVAIAENRPATFTGAAAAIRSVLVRGLGVEPGAGMVDASGLAARDRLSMATLVAVLRAVTRRAALREVLTGLPIAGWSGTLRDRFLSTSSRPAAGDVRAKTGTLTGVSVLAGLVHVRSGGLAVFAFAAVRVPATGTPGAENALDAAAARLAACACA